MSLPHPGEPGVGTLSDPVTENSVVRSLGTEDTHGTDKPPVPGADMQPLIAEEGNCFLPAAKLGLVSICALSKRQG